MNKWIKVSDRISEPFKTVWVYNGLAKVVSTDFINSEHEWNEHIKGVITHWQQLKYPEPPEIDKEVKS